MDEIIQQVSTRTGLTEAQSREAVQLVIQLVKERLPESLAAQVDTLLNMQNAGDLAQQAQSLLGGLLGKS